jgi:DNA polymerase I
LTEALATGDLYQCLADKLRVERKVAKTAMLAATYGQGARGLALALGVSRIEAAQIAADLWSIMPEAAAMKHRLEAKAEREGGRVILPCGRVILPKMVDGKPAIYASLNGLIQGASTSLLGHLIVTMRSAGFTCAFSVHDSLTFVADDPAEEAAIKAVFAQALVTPPSWLAERGMKLDLRATCYVSDSLQDPSVFAVSQAAA